jgi:hypothetical protein
MRSIEDQSWAVIPTWLPALEFLLQASLSPLSFL